MTNIVEYTEKDLVSSHPRRLIRDLSQEEFIEKYGSGTLKKSKKLIYPYREFFLLLLLFG